MVFADERGHLASLTMSVAGARRDLTGQPEGETPGRRNYLTGSDPAKWRTNVRLWERVRFAGVRPGVDVVYRGGGRQFEYDLVVAPGVDPRQIRISFTGAEKIELSQSGDMILRTKAGDVFQRKPVAYQVIAGVRRDVAAAFLLAGGRIGFEVGPYDRSVPLVIDPTIDYSAWFPGTFTALAVDSGGAAYITG